MPPVGSRSSAASPGSSLKARSTDGRTTGPSGAGTASGPGPKSGRCASHSHRLLVPGRPDRARQRRAPKPDQGRAATNRANAPAERHNVQAGRLSAQAAQARARSLTWLAPVVPNLAPAVVPNPAPVPVLSVALAPVHSLAPRRTATSAAVRHRAAVPARHAMHAAVRHPVARAGHSADPAPPAPADFHARRLARLAIVAAARRLQPRPRRAAAAKAPRSSTRP
jgi:hypothetical protein